MWQSWGTGFGVTHFDLDGGCVQDSTLQDGLSRYHSDCFLRWV